MSSPPLEYAPKPPPHRRQIFRDLVTVCVLLAIGISLLQWGSSIGIRVELLYWQHKCMTYAPRADHVIHDSNGQIRVIPPVWFNFYAALSPPGFQSDGTLFIHELKRPDGKSRLVVVDLSSRYATRQEEAVARVFKPGDIFDSPQELNLRNEPELRLNLQNSTPFKIFAGTVDPTDPSHFIFSVQQSEQSTIFDGWINNNDEVIVGPRRFTATQR